MPDSISSGLMAEQMQALFESAPNGVAALDAGGRMRIANTPLARAFGYDVGALAQQPASLLFSAEAASEHAAMREAVGGGRAARAKRELTGQRQDGSTFPVEVVLTPFMGGRDGMLLMIVVDVTERRKAEERQNLLIGELHHRTQNIFAVIQSVAMRTLSGDRTLEEARQIFVNRLHAMSRTYTTLTEGAWEGAPLDTILRDELAAFSTRVSIDGPPVMIQASAAQTFAMIVHELATNALKYGSLSVDAGRLTVRWDIAPASAGPELSLVWQEHDGPGVSKPRRKGFGRTILEDGARHLGRAEMNYAPDGFRYRLVAPLNAIGWQPDSLASSAAK